MTGSTTSKRGRPRAGEREQRTRDVIAAAIEELLAHGYEGVTMLAIASRAGASKETLYKWFGSKEGLFAAAIEANADQSADRVRQALTTDGDADPTETLVGYGVGLLTLLTSPPSVALNRAAMSSPELAEVLLANGRHRVGPIVESYLAGLDRQGRLPVADPGDAFRLLYGLVIQDTQIRVLLGEPAPSTEAILAQATAAVDRFLGVLHRQASQASQELE